MSKRTLQRLFDSYLSKAPLVPIIKRIDVNLQIDATYFAKFCLVCYQDFGLKYTQLHRFTYSESYEEIKEDLENLSKLGVKIKSVTCDGHKSILKAIKSSLPDVIIQRCVIHVQRMCFLWLTAKPQSNAGVELREIVELIHQVKTHNDRLEFKRRLKLWHEKYKQYIDQKTYQPESQRYWYTHKMVRKSYVTIKNALPNMFHYIEHADIPKSTNAIESYFGHLKNHLDLHRGLTKEHRINFIKWYIYFNNNKRFSKQKMLTNKNKKED